MISKKRYYGLALPIWTCADCDAWEVIESRDALRERAVAGWDEFDGHSPHRPWVDAVEIECRSCGGRSRRITDVGNPWLDAGIVGISTLKWTTDRDYWQEWYPADFVTESFPGQFRNWFYALITESTVMTGQAPFTTLFGYALLRDEHGEEMHKSKGNAIWFDDAAEQIGADVMRWMFSATAPGGEHELRLPPGPRGGAPLLPAALEHLRLLRHLRAARRLDAVGGGGDRWAGRRSDAAGPLDPVAPRGD